MGPGRRLVDGSRIPHLSDGEDMVSRERNPVHVTHVTATGLRFLVRACVGLCVVECVRVSVFLYVCVSS